MGEREVVLPETTRRFRATIADDDADLGPAPDVDKEVLLRRAVEPTRQRDSNLARVYVVALPCWHRC